MAEWLSSVGNVPGIIWLIGALATLVTGIWVYIQDFKNMEVVLWKILIVVVVGFVTAYAARIATGKELYWPLFLVVPIYIVLSILNSALNKKDRLIGQGDLDLFSGTIALFVAMGIVIMGNMNVTEVLDGYDMRVLDSTTLLIETLTWFLFGILIAIVCGTARSIFVYVRAKKRGEDVGKFSLYFNVIKARIPVMVAYLPCFIYSMYAFAFVI